jgi:hypothetical protein
MLDLTFVIAAYARRRLALLARQDPAAAQAAVLRRLLRRAAATRFGRAHGFSRLGSVAAYQRAVPLRRYEAFWEEWWRPGFPVLRDVTWPGLVPFFAESSGTSTGVSKFIPVTWPMARANRWAAADTLAFHVAAHPGSRVLGGRNLLLGGSTALRHLAAGVRAGDLSGIAALLAPPWTRGRLLPPREVALLGDWDRKLAAMAAGAGPDLVSISGSPSWMLLLFERIAALHGGERRLAALLPRLELIVHGGMGIEPYRPRLAPWLEGGRVALREVYPASEGFIAIADGPAGEEGLRPVLDRNLFLEFVPRAEIGAAAPTRHWIATAEPGEEYALVLSSDAGLWSYVIGDTVRLLRRDPPRLRVTGRLAQELSVFGEHLSAGELDRAVAAAAARCRCTVLEYTAAAVFPDQAGGRGRHVFVIETPDLPDPGRFAAALDAALAAGNADYATHRQGGVQLLPPELRVVPPGTFEAWMRRRGRLGGQNKVPRVLDAARLAALLGQDRPEPERGGPG